MVSARTLAGGLVGLEVLVARGAWSRPVSWTSDGWAVWLVERMSVDAQDAAVFEGVPGGGGAAAEVQWQADPAARAGAGLLGAVAAELVTSGRRRRRKGRRPDLR